MAGFDNEVVYGSNVDFTGSATVTGQMTADGQLLIGSAVAPFIRAANLTSTGGTLTITNGAGTINLETAGGLAPVQHLTGNTGGTLNPTANNFNVVGTGSITIAGVGSTLTAQLTGLTQYAVLVGNGTATINSGAPLVGTTGQLFTGNTGAAPGWATTIPASITFAVANSGTDVTFTNSNLSNTASSVSVIKSLVAGTTASDPFFSAQITGGQEWTWGLDNSDSDAFAIASSSALGTNNVMRVTTTGAVSFTLGNVDVTKSSSGATVSTTISNTSNTASSNALEQITVAGTSAGDPFTTYTVTGGSSWSLGADNSVTGDPFVIAASTALGTTNILSASTAGNINLPLQCKFSAYLNASDLDATGDGTVYTLGGTTALTELYDIGSNFNTNGTFTAPVTGYYHFDFGVLAQQAVATMTATLTLTVAGTSARSYIFGNYGTVGTGNWPMSSSRTIHMTATDTAVVSSNFSNGTKVVDFYGAANDPRTYFSGELIG